MSDPTVVLGQIEHETNTFSSLPTGIDQFADASLHYGDTIPPEFRGSNTAIGGFLRVADEKNWNVVPTVAADATPGGIVTADALSSLLDEVLTGIEESEPDAVLLALHGAMVSEDHPDGDGYILERVREAAGDIPVMASLDLHANISERMVEHADGLFGYDTYPHVDIGDTGETAARAMAATLSGDLDPQVVVERAPLLPPLPPLQTDIEPMESLLQQAAASEAKFRPDVSVFGGFAYADVEEAGFSVVGVSDTHVAEETRATCKALAESAYERRHEFDHDYTSVGDAVEAAANWDADTEGGPLLLADLADNPGGGSAEDGTVILESLLDAGIEDAALALIVDPDAVAAAVEAGVGNTVAVDLGGHVEDNGDPLAVEGRVRLISDGSYRNYGPMSRGLRVNLGRTAVLEIDGIDVIVGSHRQQPYDPEAFRRMGITPERQRVLVLKSTVHYRAAFEPMAGAIREVAAPGLCHPDLTQFDYEHVSRPLYPLDEDD
ncbi:M81 family peptidase [Halogeometricum borinquense]|uniref:M81 family peptidase n=1 Tax=Halogeometricum borinquense TaxID=60847 RepID=A0A482T0G7_9EURY|nr:M81 family metallopeptidase [Halogeometricum borinquense]RYJ08406.1 M81 family peptidase [Halogeometricum borinquense]